MQESGEMYLETILVLKEQNEYVRAIDIGNELKFSKPSVSRALKILKESGYIAVDDKGHIELTDIGLSHAKKIYERHLVLTKHLESLGVDKDTASIDACRIEHVISDESFKAIKRSVE